MGRGLCASVGERAALLPVSFPDGDSKGVLKTLLVPTEHRKP